MKTRKTLLMAFGQLFALGAIVVVCGAFGGCADDLADDHFTRDGAVRFQVSESQNWDTKSQINEDSERIVGDVIALSGENSTDSLFMHTIISENIDMGHLVCDSPETRAEPINQDNFYEAFGVLGFAYAGEWNEASCQPDYMYNVSVTKASGWSTSYMMPGLGQNVRFCAYAPYNCEGVVLSDKLQKGFPEITYTVPFEAVKQNDLLVAVSDEVAGTTKTPVSLNFSHALTAVRFVTGDDVLAGSITKVTLKGVYNSATLKFGNIWDNYKKEVADFSQTVSKNVSGEPNEAILPEEMTFMMLPQTLPDGASVEVVFTDNLTSTQRTLKADIAGSEWSMGKTITYKISTTSILAEKIFEVTPNILFSPAGGTVNYTIKSSVKVNMPDGSTAVKPLGWTAQFVEENENGGYDVISQPDWITQFTTLGQGGVDAETKECTVSESIGIPNDFHNDVLKQTPAVSGTYDLATKGGTEPMRTANCYVINAPGQYSLPLVYGNAIDFKKYPMDGINRSAYTSSASAANVLTQFVNHLDQPITDPYIYKNANCEPADAILVWQDEENLVTNVALTGSGDDYKLVFDVASSTIQQGNAIVAVRDASETIMWSWHIWVTDFVPGLAPTVEPNFNPLTTPRDKTITNFQNQKYTLMGTNIGWCWPKITEYQGRSVMVLFTQETTGKTQLISIEQYAALSMLPGNNSYFQFGRKDPILPGDNISGTEADKQREKDCFSSSGYAFGVAPSGQTTIGKSIQNPHLFVGQDRSSSHWCTVPYYNLWNGANTSTGPINGDPVVKTVYDPSPVGYCLPPSNVFTGFTYNGKKITDYSEFEEGFEYLPKINTQYTSKYQMMAMFGYVLYCNRMNGTEGGYDTSGGVFYMPFSGYRRSSGGLLGELMSVGSNGCYWTCGLEEDNWAYEANLNRSYIRVGEYISALPYQAVSIRPMVEQ